jgi:phosphoenolpyruvate synthase/pyruvate phosphate dikinase
VHVVWASARTEAALAYRTRKGLPPHPKIATVVQMLVEPVACRRAVHAKSRSPAPTSG